MAKINKSLLDLTQLIKTLNELQVALTVEHSPMLAPIEGRKEFKNKLTSLNQMLFKTMATGKPLDVVITEDDQTLIDKILNDFKGLIHLEKQLINASEGLETDTTGKFQETSQQISDNLKYHYNGVALKNVELLTKVLQSKHIDSKELEEKRSFKL